MKYVHPTIHESGQIVHNNHHIFVVTNGEVEVLDDGRPYNILAEHGFVQSTEPSTGLTIPRSAAPISLAAPDVQE